MSLDPLSLPKLEIRLLGAPEIRRNGDVDSGLPLAKTRALLYYLAMTGHAHTRVALTGLLWGDQPEDAARSSLRKTISQLRDSFGPYLAIDRNTVRFHADQLYWCDAVELESRLGAAYAETDLEPLQQAVALYRGDFLEGFYVRHAPEYENWMLGERARLRALMLQGLHTLTVRYTSQGNLAQAIDSARRLLAFEPWHEETHRQLMLLLARSGQRAAALAQYELCRRAIEVELDVEPDPETTQLYEQIRTGTLELDRGAAPAVAATAATPLLEQTRLPESFPQPKHNLPAQITPFIGRTAELAALAQLLDTPDLRLVTILGLGGMGKTRLALEAASAQVGRYRHGVYYVPLAPLDDADSLIQTIAGAVRYSFQAGPGTPRQQLLDYLSGKQILLLLDNFEHLAEGAGLVHELLQAAPELRLLVTSRERLRLSGETILRLDGLDLPAPGETEVSGSAAIQLFVQQARRVQPGFAPAPETWQAIAEVCRLVQGMPLGLLLAASWSATLTPEDIAAEIRRGLDFLTGDLRDLPERQRSMAAVLAQTWARLEEEEFAAFVRMALFRGGFTRQAAQAVTDATLATLSALVDKALLARNAEGRYDIHELLRQSAQQRLHAAGSVEQAHAAHSAYYLDLLHRYEADLKGGRQVAALQELDAENENIRAAWQWALQHDQVDRLAHAAEGLARFHMARGRYHEGEIACRQLTTKLSSMPGRRQWMALILVWQALFDRILGRSKETIQLLEQSLVILKDLNAEGEDVRITKAFALCKLASILGHSDNDRSKRLLDESLALCRATGDPWQTAEVLFELGGAYAVFGDLAQAKQTVEESLHIRRALGDYAGMLNTLILRTWIAIDLGELNEVDYYAQEYYILGKKIGDPGAIAHGFWLLGLARFYRGEFDQALALYEQSWDISVELNDQYHLNGLRMNLAQAYLHLGEYQQAGAQATAGLAGAAAIDLLSHRGDALLHLSQVRLAESAYADALHQLEEVVTIYEEMQNMPKLARALMVNGYAAWGAGNLPLARRCLVKGLQMAAAWQLWLEGIPGLALAAPLLAEQGKLERAVGVYTAALQHPFIANSRWYQKIAGQFLEATAADLPEAARAKAVERGQRVPWQEVVASLLATEFGADSDK